MNVKLGIIHLLVLCRDTKKCKNWKKLYSFICENVKISDNCFIGHSVNFINDKFKNNKIEKTQKNFLKRI